MKENNHKESDGRADRAIFFTPRGPFRLSDLLTPIKDRIGLTTPLAAPLMESTARNVAGLDLGDNGDISFCQSPRYKEQLQASRAEFIFMLPALRPFAPPTAKVIEMKEPQLAFALVGLQFYPRPVASKHSIHPTAVIDKTAVIEQPVVIGPYAVIGAGARIGAGTTIGAQTVIDEKVVLGRNNIIGDNCSISYCLMGNDCDIDTGVRIGGRGFGLAMAATGLVRLPQLGMVRIGNGVCISCNTVVDRGAAHDTVIADNVQIDNLVAVGHNSRIDRSAVVCSMVGLAGSSKIGAGVFLAGQVGVADHVVVGAGARISAQGGAISDVPAGATVSGHPTMPHRQFLKAHFFLKNILARGHNNKNDK